jgi:hypothetical protein
VNDDAHPTPAPENTPLSAILDLVAAGELRRATEMCAAALARAPDDPALLLARSTIEAHEGRFAAALATAEAVAADRPPGDGAHAHVEHIRDVRATWECSAHMQAFFADRETFRDFPRVVAIETTGRCNATCGFCPNDVLERAGEVMSDQLFEKILADLSEIPPEPGLEIYPNFVNEPFMDRNLMRRLRRINEVLPTARMTLFTNFNVLPKGFFDDIREIRGLKRVNVSFNAANRADYRRIMGIDFDRTVANVTALLAANRQDRFLDGPVVLSRVGEGGPGDQAYAGECRGLFPGFDEGRDFVAHVKSRADWLGGVDEHQSAVPFAYPCGAWFDLNIMCTGKVPLCCMDSEGKFEIGDVNTRSVLEIYNGATFRAYREGPASRETVYPCNTCALIQ